MEQRIGEAAATGESQPPRETQRRPEIVLLGFVAGWCGAPPLAWQLLAARHRHLLAWDRTPKSNDPPLLNPDGCSPPPLALHPAPCARRFRRRERGGCGQGPLAPPRRRRRRALLIRRPPLSHWRQGLTLVPISAQLELTLPHSAQLKLTLSPI
jgi:hypothetical protein